MAKNIKYFNIILIAVLAVFLICSCDNKDNNSDDSFDSDTTENIVSDTETDTNTDTIADTIADTDTETSETEDTDAAETTAEGYEIITVNGERFAVIPYEYDRERNYAHHYYYSSDLDKKLDLLLSEYISTGEGYEDLLEIVYYRYVCDSELLYATYTELEYYHNENDLADFPNYMLRKIYDGDKLGTEYYVARYGSITTFDEYESYMYQHFDYDLISYIFEGTDLPVINVNGYIFSRDCGIGKNGQLRNPEYSLMADEELIVLCEKRWEIDWDKETSSVVITDECVYDYYILEKVKTNIGNYRYKYFWKWKEISYSYSAYEEYEEYKGITQ